MLRILSVFFALIAAVLGVYVWQLSGEVSSLRDQLATASKDAAAARTAETTARHDADALREKDVAATAAADSKPADQSGLPGALSAKAGVKKKPEGEGMSAAMAKMFQSEDGKKMMKAQIGAMTKMQYADLIRKLNLSPEEADKVMNLLTERGNAIAGNPWKIMNEGLDEAAIKKLKEETDATQKNYDAMLKNELGDDGFQQFKDYENSIGERMTLSQIEPQMSAAGAPLQPEQRDQLLQLMSAERKNSPPSPFDPTGRDAAGNMKAMMDDSLVDTFLKQEDDYHQRVLQQAATILSPDQVKSLQAGFTQTSEMQKFGIKMSKEMFKKAPAAGQ